MSMKLTAYSSKVQISLLIRSVSKPCYKGDNTVKAHGALVIVHHEQQT